MEESYELFLINRLGRLLKETGRFSISPVYVVGIYSGSDQLGEGFGSSLKMAEYRAAEDALQRVYLTRVPTHLLKIPSTTLSRDLFEDIDLEVEDVEEQLTATAYVPGELGQPESQVESGGRGRGAHLAPKTTLPKSTSVGEMTQEHWFA